MPWKGRKEGRKERKKRKKERKEKKGRKERKEKKRIPFKTESNRIEYLEMYLTEEVKNLYTENYKTLMKEIEKDTNKWKDTLLRKWNN